MERVQIDSLDDFPEFAYRQAWTDGLPVFAPTRDAVQRMIDASGRGPDEVLGVVFPGDGEATIANVAANCVMAGCLPEYMPVVLAAAEAIIDPRFNLRFNSRSTRGPAPLLVINGPIRQKLGINCRSNVFGPGWRANATIGRAVRLMIRNVGGAVPGEMDRATRDANGSGSAIGMAGSSDHVAARTAPTSAAGSPLAATTIVISRVATPACGR